MKEKYKASNIYPSILEEHAKPTIPCTITRKNQCQLAQYTHDCIAKIRGGGGCGGE